MKVLVIGARGFPGIQGGVEKHCEELYPALVKQGCDVTVFARAPYFLKEKRVEAWKGVKFKYIWCPRKKAIEAAVHTFLGIIRARKLFPDVVHIHAIGPSLFAPLAKLLKMKVVMTHHGPDYERSNWGRTAKFVLRLGERAGVLYSDNVIAISGGIQALIKEKYNKNAVLIPNGVNIPLLVPPGEELKRRGLEPKGYIFTACRFVPEKGLHDLIEAYKSINTPSFKLVIAGDADHETGYSRRIKKLAAGTEGIILTGFVSGDRLGELFTNAGLFVLPSYYEGLPIALLEALSYSLPVLVSDIPQHREIPLRGFRYFRLGNIKNLSEAIVDAFTRGISVEEKESLVSLIKDAYNWDSIVLKTLETYKRVV